jgi:hypothetical protein
MSLEIADKIAKAVLYEGYLLYPYYPSSTKNRQRWTFGGLYPRKFVERNEMSADAAGMQCECLLECGPESDITVRLRFLQMIARESPRIESWEEAIEREVVLDNLSLAIALSQPFRRSFAFAKEESRQPIDGGIEITATRVSDRLFRLTVRVSNTTPHSPSNRREALLHSLMSAHLLLSIERGAFVSMIDPPEPYRKAAEQCQNTGTWPVLVGTPGNRSLMLSAPIILYDYPQIAPESPGDLFDGTEIDEILSLRILTLSDEEKERVRAADFRGRQILERTEKLTGEELFRMHGALRDAGFKPGSKVRLRPKNPSDIFDLTLSGMTATVEAIEHDLEGQAYLSVTVDEDPGRDLGKKGQPGHRFFFRPEDVESL